MRKMLTRPTWSAGDIRVSPDTGAKTHVSWREAKYGWHVQLFTYRQQRSSLLVKYREKEDCRRHILQALNS